MADHLGDAYLRYSFTKGTENEVSFLVDVLGLEPGHRVLDVGCGPGRHAYALAERGIEVVGVDISERFIEIASSNAPVGASFIRMDARKLVWEGEFDAAISLCQGAFGLLGGMGISGEGVGGENGEDGEVLANMMRALRPGGSMAVSAFSAYFQVRWLEETDQFDAATGVNHEKTMLRDSNAKEEAFDLWTTCFTPRELRLLAERVSLSVREIWSVTPGSYSREAPNINRPEFLMVAEKPTSRL